MRSPPPKPKRNKIFSKLRSYLLNYIMENIVAKGAPQLGMIVNRKENSTTLMLEQDNNKNAALLSTYLCERHVPSFRIWPFYCVKC